MAKRTSTRTATRTMSLAGKTPLAKRGQRQNPAAVYLAGLAPGSRRTMRDALTTIARLASDSRASAQAFPWDQLRHEHTAAIRAGLAERYSAATCNKMLSALRGVLKSAWRLGQMNGEDYQRAADIQTVKGSRLPRGRSLPAGELRALFEACGQDRSPAGRRDAALLAVLYGAGVRRSEAVALDLGDYNPETGELKIRAAKGNKDRTGYASNGSRDAILEWLAIRGNEPGPLFLPIDKGGRIQIRRMTDQAVLNMCEKRAHKAGIKHFSPHDLRRSFVGDMLDAGADVSLVQQLAGHANVQTTMRYDRRPEAAKRKAAELLLVPFSAPRATP